jgi:hypothetical protein
MEVAMLSVRRMSVVLTVAVAVSGLLVSTSATCGEADLADVMAELTEALKLSDEQVVDVEKAMTAYLTNLDNAQAKYEDQEEPDGQAMLGEFKKIRDDYYKNLQKILSKDQWKLYEAIREKILHELFSEIAGLRIIDLKEPLSLTDDQMEKMKPVMGKALRDFVGTIFEYGDQKMNKRTQLRMGSSLKGIKSEMDSQMKTILSEEQIATWDKIREDAKS